MLQRAASNAYSWWWASHIRTKQSKWMEQNLQDMEEKVEAVLKLLQEDGDSFAKRAEMYYKGRPELIAFVEETYRAYRALAERYDHISKELQNANNTIASICPEQVPYMDEDDEDGSPRVPRRAQEGFKANVAEGFKANAAEGFKANAAEGFKTNAAEGLKANAAEEFKANAAPKVPKPPPKDLKSVITSASKKFCTKKTPTKTSAPKEATKSGLSKKEALDEIDQLQKKILTLQTVKEFVKSSYDNAIAKYWDTEEEIKELQERVSRLQNEFGEGMVIEDDEARRLMTEAALKTCQETLAQLLVKQERSCNETKIETTRVRATREKLESLMREFHYDQINRKEPRARKDVKEIINIEDLDEDVERMTQQRQELQLLQDKIKEQLEASSNTSISVTEMAEKIDELVNKVISLETSVSSQDALITRMRTETDELQSQIHTLEEDKASLINEKTDLNNQLRDMDEKMHGIQDLEEIVETQNNNLQTYFNEARCNLDHLCEEVQNVKPDMADEVMDLSKRERKSSGEAVPKHGVVEQDTLNQEHVLLRDVKSDKKHKDLGLVNNGAQKDNETQKDNEIKVTGLVDNDVQKGNKIKVTGSGNNGVQEHNNIKVTGLVDNDKQKDDEIKVTDSPENEAKSNNNLEVTGPLEKKEASPMARKPPTEPEEQEKSPNTGNSDTTAKSAPSITARDQDLSQHKASKEANSFSESSGNQQAKNGNQILSETESTHEVHSQKQATAQEDEPDWRQLFIDGMQEKEKVLLAEYTSTLRNYKEVKKKLSEAEKKTQDTLFDTSVKLKELKTSIALKDEEIKLLRRKLGLMERSLEGNEDLAESRAIEEPAEEEEENEEILKVDQPDSASAIEEKFRRNIDEILEENLGFWLKFSTTFTEIQKFETTIKDLQTDVSKLEEKGKSSESVKQSVKSDARPIYKHLVEIQNELSVWLDKSASLKEELQRRSSSLREIQEEITKALKASAEDDDFKFTSYQAAKFQGEVLNMKQENNKVADELQAGLDHVSTLQLDVEKDLAKMSEQFGLSNPNRPQTAQLRHSDSSRSRVPLGAFIFGVKPKKQKHSIFSSITPGVHRKYRALKGHGYT